MLVKLTKTLFFLLLFGYVGAAISGSTSTEEAEKTEKAEMTEKSMASEVESSMEGEAFAGDFEAGEMRYNQTCKNCHGTAGKGAASYPKISGNEISYTKEKLETYRDGIKIGPNSFLMIMNAKPLTDEEILNLAAYLKDATF